MHVSALIPGQDGQNGSDLTITAEPVLMDGDQLTIEVVDRGKSKSVVTFNTHTLFILLRAAGGDGGGGGEGGKGGTGGEDT